MGEIILKSNSTPSTPSAGYGSLYEDSADKLLKFKNEIGNVYDVSGGTGWIPASETWTYKSADDPTYVFDVNADVTTKYSPGMRVKITQSTGGTKYAIITAVGAYASGKTPITCYWGTDYNLENEAISNPYWSPLKAPYGFPLDPLKWMVTKTDTSLQQQSSPTQNTWYNLGSVSITIPIGAWNVDARVAAISYKGTATIHGFGVCLSTANNSASDASLTAYVSQGSTTLAGSSIVITGNLNLATKTVYYLNTQTIVASLSEINNDNANSTLVIRAICAYL